MPKQINSSGTGTSPFAAFFRRVTERSDARCSDVADAQHLRSTHSRRVAARWIAAVALLLAGFSTQVASLRADDPFAPTREYNLQNARIELRFDIDQRSVQGQVTHTLTALHDDVRQFDFDSVALVISSVRVNGRDARFRTDDTKLHVELERPTKAGEKYEIAIRYEGKPKKGLYFVLPDKSNPNQPKQVWTQGEAQDTRYYIPIYDYPNNRTSTEMIVTVPRDWVTISNGKLQSVTDTPDHMKVWTWRQSQPISSYLISVVAGEFDESKQTWRNIPVNYYVPRGQRDRIEPTFSHTRDMLTFFSDRLGVPYPWDKYDQTMVDQFVEGGMENVSASTLTSRGLLHPVLAGESLERSDTLISHEMAHQWFGDLVTCKDWANLWLNEGFATFLSQVWEEQQYGADNAGYSRWRAQNGWLRQQRLYSVPIVTRDFNDSMKYAGNVYGKAGLVLQMLRDNLGDDAFFHGLQHYLEQNRLGNVVTADLVKALEESTHKSLDRFFDQWIYGAGAPRFAITSAYDANAKQLRLTVKQTQDVRGQVGLFDVPVEVAVTTAGSTKSFPIQVSKAEETFSVPAESEPLMVLFDKGDKILKSVEFRKSPAEWSYQLQHAEDVPDRAAAAFALGDVKDNPAVVAALGQAATTDNFWGVRVESLLALGRIGGEAAEQRVLAALNNSEPWVREVAVTQLGRFHDEATLVPRVSELFRNDPAYRVRAAALAALGQMKAPGARELLESAAKTDSPDDIIRRAALRAMGVHGDNRSVRSLLQWSSQQNPVRIRAAAIASLAQLDRKNREIETRLLEYLRDPSFDIRFSAVVALGERGDPAAIPDLEALLNSGETTSGMGPVLEEQIARLKRGQTAKEHEGSTPDTAAGLAAPTQSNTTVQGNQQDTRPPDTNIAQRLENVEKTLAEMNERLKRIEQNVSGVTQ